MSDLSAAVPQCRACAGGIELAIESRRRDLGGFSVRRVLPAPERRMVGPFIFFDHMGPAQFAPGEGIQVRPHPHIGLSTITYLFEGEILHRDSLGFVQPIRAGAVNLMTAGRGIVHSERPPAEMQDSYTLHGIQSWMALPEELEESAPAFEHYAANALPVLSVGGAELRLIIGRFGGAASPVRALSPTLYLDCRLAAGAELEIPAQHGELAAYVVEGTVRSGNADYAEGVMVVAQGGSALRLATAAGPAHVMVIGGAPLGARHIWWNFVSSSEQRIEQAARDWEQGRFPAVPGDLEHIPLPK